MRQQDEVNKSCLLSLAGTSGGQILLRKLQGWYGAGQNSHSRTQAFFDTDS